MIYTFCVANQKGLHSDMKYCIISEYRITKQGVYMIDIGQRLKDLRKEKGLTQEELSERTDLTKGYVSQLENNISSPSLDTLMDLLEVLGCSPSEFFDEKSNQQKVIYHKEDTTDFVDEEMGYKLRWLIPASNENEMEPVKITFDQNGEFKEFDPSSAETFGYVLTGSVKIILGEETFIAQKGEAFYYYCAESHQIVNNQSSKSELLLVVTDSYL